MIYLNVIPVGNMCACLKQMQAEIENAMYKSKVNTLNRFLRRSL